MTVDDNPRTEVMIPERPRTLLARHGSRAELREYAARIQRSIPVRLPNGDTRAMTQTEALHLATGAITHGLDPYIGQIYLLVVKDVPMLHVGPAGYHVAASRQLKKEGGGSWHTEFTIISDEAERKGLLVPPAGIAYHCRLYDTRTTLAYVEGIKAATAAGATWEQAIAVFGQKPFTPGLGIYVPKGGKPDEMYPPHSRAKKRAEHDALKRRFGIEFDGASDGDLPGEYTGQMAPDKVYTESTPADNVRPPGDGQPIQGQPSRPVEDDDDEPGPASPDDFTDPAKVAAAIDATQRARRDMRTLSGE